MKTITVKKTINKGNYENMVIEIILDRPSGMGLEPFLCRVKEQLDKAIEVINK